MKPLIAVLILAAAGCGDSSNTPLAKADAKGAPKKVRVLHILVAFQGAMRAAETVTRTQDEADVLAKELLARAKRGEDFKKLMKEFSTDTGEGDYTLVNHGFPRHGREIARATFAPAFANVAFSLGVGEFGLAEYHTANSPFGYHVIKRIE